MIYVSLKFIALNIFVILWMCGGVVAPPCQNCGCVHANAGCTVPGNCNYENKTTEIIKE
jgi:hypothetical protein